jgi:glutamine synthetase
VKEIAALHGQSVSFMAKYDIDRVGSSCHIHSSLWPTNGEGSAMPDASGPHGMSDTARWWLGGLMAGARELAWCFAPYVNSYKRYQPASWAPTAIAWGLDNRTLGFRVVGHGDGRRAECRIPGADANPYAFAATIASGLHGIEHKIEPGDPTSATATPQATCPECRTPSSRRSSCSKARPSRRRRSVRRCTSTC